MICQKEDLEAFRPSKMSEHQLVLALGRDGEGGIPAMCLTCFEEFTLAAFRDDAPSLAKVKPGEVMHFNFALCTFGDY